MKHLYRIFRLVPVVAVAVVFMTGTAWAQLPTPEAPAGGYCAPWHRCVAYGALGLTVISVLLFGVGYLVQSRGFDKIEHRQGNPDGVPTGKE